MLNVDDYSRWMWVNILRTKDQTLPAFTKFKTLEENMRGCRIKTLRTDRGGEFLSANFTKLCEETRIERHYTAPYSPQQNGVVERRNRSIMDMTRSLLKSMNLPGRFWGEAVRHAVYLLNRLPTKAMGDRTPFEAWYGKKPHVGHLRVFGCTAHAKVTTPHLKKLDDRSHMMIYLGVEDGSKAHRLYDPRQNKIQVSRDVKFEENREWNWNAGAVISESSDVIFEETSPSQSVLLKDSVSDNDTGATDQVTPGSITRSPSTVHAASVTARTPHTLPATPERRTAASDTVKTSLADASPLPVDGDDSHDGPIRYRHMDDIMKDTRRVELEKEFAEEEAMLIVTEEQSCYREAAGQPEWENAMDKEIEAIKKNSTWSLVKLPARHKAIGLKWVFKLKKNSEGEIIKHKARLVVKGYVQQQGIDFDEVFTPVTRLDTVRVMLAIAENRGWQVHHLEVKSAFLNGELQEEVYVTQPEGYEVKGKESLVYKLYKALYGLRQAPRAWNMRLDRSLKELGFTRCTQKVHFN